MIAVRSWSRLLQILSTLQVSKPIVVSRERKASTPRTGVLEAWEKSLSSQMDLMIKSFDLD